MNKSLSSSLEQFWAQYHVAVLQILFVIIAFLFAQIVGNPENSPLYYLPSMVWRFFGLGHREAQEPLAEDHDDMPTSQLIRRRSDLVERHELTKERTPDVEYDPSRYPGLVNISGTYCFLNATLQGVASLAYLHPFLDDVVTSAEKYDVPTPVTDALRSILSALNQPSARRYFALRPVDIISALANSSHQNHNTLFLSREHQDAQELFQLLSSVLQEEAIAVEQEAAKDTGLRAFSEASQIGRGLKLRAPFSGLTAQRRSCSECGYTEAVMHFPFDNITLAVPPLAACNLRDCLIDYTRLERLSDCVCRKCSLVATMAKLGVDAARLSSTATKDMTSSKNKRTREAKKLEARVRAALDEARIEEDINGVKVEKVYSRSTKQIMFARPPPVLTIHLNRSTYYGGGYAGRNPCRVSFPELLDLTDFTTSGELNTDPEESLSGPPPFRFVEDSARLPVFYRLSSVVCHYGTHSYGHYVAFRRKPDPPSINQPRFRPPRTSCAVGCSCDDCIFYGPVREGNAGRHSRWLRISDDVVEEVDIMSVLAETSGTFMLYYERVQFPHQDSGGDPSAATSSDTLVRPDVLRGPRGRVLLSVNAGRHLSPVVSEHSSVQSDSDLLRDGFSTDSTSSSGSPDEETHTAGPEQNGGAVDGAVPLPEDTPQGLAAARSSSSLPRSSSDSSSPVHSPVQST